MSSLIHISNQVGFQRKSSHAVNRFLVVVLKGPNRQYSHRHNQITSRRFIQQKKYYENRISLPRLAFSTESEKVSSFRAPDEKELTEKIHKSSGQEHTNMNNEEEEDDVLVYEGPFAGLSLRLKRISLSSAILSIIGIPAIIINQTINGDVPVLGQFAVGGTAIFAACGSTAMLSFCFTPYVHELHWEKTVSDDESTQTTTSNNNNEKKQMKIITRDFFTRRLETVFDPYVDIETDIGGTYRPFCNFKVKGLPFYVHPEMIQSDEVRNLLIDEKVLNPNATEDKSKDDDW